MWRVHIPLHRHVEQRDDGKQHDDGKQNGTYGKQRDGDPYERETSLFLIIEYKKWSQNGPRVSRAKQSATIILSYLSLMQLYVH